MCDIGCYNLAMAILDRAVVDYKNSKVEGYWNDANALVLRDEVAAFLRSDWAQWMAETVGIEAWSNFIKKEVTT